MNRILQLDALRGFALLGIVLGNVQWFSGYAVDPLPSKDILGLDAATTFGLHLWVDGKFYALFSLLFGASFRLLSDRGRGSAALRRRLLALFAVGLVHATVLWFGDILSLYAVAAAPLLVLQRRSVRTQWRWALGLLLAPAVLSAVLWLGLPTGETPGWVHGPTALLPAFGSGEVLGLWRANAVFLEQRWVLALASGRLFRLLGLFVLGGLLVRDVPQPSRSTRAWLYGAALVTNLAYAALAHVPPLPPSALGLLRDTIACVALPLGALAYASWLWPRLARGRLAHALAQAGRLSLTHYLGQSLVLAALFYGVGLGQWGRLGATGSVLVGASLAALQVAVSPWLRRRFPTGLAERLLRYRGSRRPA